jgi:MFS family permease
MDPYAGRFLVAIAISLFAVSQAMPVLVVSPLIRQVGITEMEFGVTFSVASILLIFAAPFWGKRSDRYGRRPLVLLGLGGAAVGTLAIALTLESGLRGYLSGMGLLVALGFARFAYAGLASAIYPSSSAYMADVTTREQRAQGMALLGAANGMGAVIGPLLVAALAFIGVLYPMYAAALLTLIAAIVAYFKLPEPAQHSHQNKSAPIRATDSRLRPYMVTWCLLFMVFMAMQFVTAFFVADQLGIEDPGDIARSVALALVAMAIVIMVMQGAVLQFIRVSPTVLYKWCSPLFMLALIVMAYSTSLFQLALSFAIVGLAFSCAAPGINGSASLSVEPHEQGAAAGFLAAANTLGAILGPVVGTSLYTLGPKVPLLSCAALMAGVSLFALTVKPVKT